MSTLPITKETEDIEGIGESQSASWGNYPIDTLLIRNESRTVHDVLRRIKGESFVMDPDFQRDFIWPSDKQSKLIESVLMRIPLPVFYLAEDDLGRMVVVDGLQRLTTFQRFVGNELALQLPEQPDLHKKRFDDLTPKLKNRIEDCNLILYVIDAKVPEQARLDIFERVNGGVPLTRQQMRNCLFMGPATRFLKEEAGTELFREVTGGSLNKDTMRDREFVNRFCAFQLLSTDLYRDMDEFLAQGLRKMNSLSADEFAKLSREFRNSLRNNFHVFGRHAFRKHYSGQIDRSILNASLWDVMSTGLSRYTDAIVNAHTDAIRDAFYQLLADEEFVRSITYSVNDMKRVRYRFFAARQKMQEVLGAPTD